ncbi:MAG: DUF167 domain-containing protein [Thermoguttaceae bacterium]|nr:DUF167 domain-containing protein [Thermoguttaceae bacterium]
MLELTQTPDGVILLVKAQPGARKNEVAGERNGRLIVKCTQAPEKGKANDAIIEILAKALDVRKSRISLVSGQTNSEKKFLIEDATIEEVERLGSRY